MEVPDIDRLFIPDDDDGATVAFRCFKLLPGDDVVLLD